MVTYEEKLVEWLFHFDKEIRDVMFSEDFDLLLSNTPILKYPSIVFSRKSEDWTASRLVDVYDNKQKYTFQELHQDYEGRIVFEKQSEAISFASKLRFYWSHNPYLLVPFLDKELSVGLRLQYIKVESERDNMDKKGAKRLVRFSWFSNLFMLEQDEYPTYSGIRVIVQTSINEVIKALEKYE